jgi:formylmethanofuran dehydrogenase subunit E
MRGMNKYKVWDINNTEEDAREIEAWDHKSAAEKFSSKFFADLDYPKSLDLAIKDSEGKIEYFAIEVESEPIFRATQCSPIICSECKHEILVSEYGLKHYKGLCESCYHRKEYEEIIAEVKKAISEIGEHTSKHES